MPTHADLRERFKAIPETAAPEAWRVRIHRALSWLSRADAETDDPDARFLFLWIAFNAAYASEFGFEQSERHQAREFVERLVALDTERHLHRVVFEQFSGPVRTLIDNRFVFEPFWTALREHDSSNRWETGFARGNEMAMAAMLGQDTPTVLSIVFDRLYVLRNQLVHGGATWNSQVNRQQLRDGVAILGTLVPLILAVMLEHPHHDFGEVLYPVV